MSITIQTANLGFPRMGVRRELKQALESYWKGAITQGALLEVAANLRLLHWQTQKAAGIEVIPSNDDAFYDQVLDMTTMLGAVPSRFGYTGGEVSLDLYFAMARGTQNAPAMEMTKWFDTNYHYIVPELRAQTQFALTKNRALVSYEAGKKAGIETRPVIIGPVSYLILAKFYGQGNRFDLLPSLLNVYGQILSQLKAAGVQSVQIDEPCLVLDLSAEAAAAYKTAYETLSKESPDIMLTTYFGGLGNNLELATSLPVSGFHIDLVRCPEQLQQVASKIAPHQTLSVGVVDGRNIWKTDFKKAMTLIESAQQGFKGKGLLVAPSCSLLHSPVDLICETNMKPELRNWLSFAVQKLEELKKLSDAACGRKDETAFAENAAAMEQRRTSALVNNAAVQERLKKVTSQDSLRSTPFAQRIALQQQALKLPLLPTTTIGSYPQTKDVREIRAQLKKGQVSEQAYTQFMEQKIVETMKWQDTIGIDVPVHGEYERNDMVEYFGEQLEGFAFTQNGWVQSYGSRCVKPPFIYGDVSRPRAMTVQWSAFAQQHTQKPVKGMLTGPVTILQWSFVRDDQPRSTTCHQIALSIRDEVQDLEKAGIHVIQIDEPALREGLPLRQQDWTAYLAWATEAFRLSASGVKDTTQIHTHMCYAEFNDIIEAIAALDADVISIETSRSNMELLEAFVKFKYPNDIGPGVYDIHSPRFPTQGEMERLLEKALEVLKPEQIWVNPDCGLKTRDWAQVEPALKSMIAAAVSLRQKLNVSREKQAS